MYRGVQGRRTEVFDELCKKIILINNRIFVMVKISILVLMLMLMVACGNDDGNSQEIDEDKLGFIEADVESEETNLKNKAVFVDYTPGTAPKFDRAFENAPPMIPHTTEGFFPIKVDNNICLSCHTPELAEDVGAIPMPETHFASLRPKLIKEGDKYVMPENSKVTVKELKEFNTAYFSCSQCHAPQADITVDIKNLFTPEFRAKLGKEKSNLKEKVKEGIEK
jgi:nitrate reductase (cytochrome), electron transfer subunit